MTDWADEIAANLVEETSTEGYDGCFYFSKSISEYDCAAALRAAELRGRVAGMREAALIAGHSKIITHNVVLDGETIPSTEWCRDPNAQEIYAAINSAAAKLESPPTT